jgi:hypothetical protein
MLLHRAKALVRWPASAPAVYQLHSAGLAPVLDAVIGQHMLQT